MRKSFLALLLGTLVSGSAVAAESADLTVTGTIRPAACDLNLSGNGALDYGTISAQDLRDNDYTVLPQQELALSVRCDAPARVAIRAIQGRSGTAAGRSHGAYGSLAPADLGLSGRIGTLGVHGLGLDSAGNRIGAYNAVIVPNTVLLDGSSVQSIMSSDDGMTWDTSSGTLFWNNSDRWVSWSTDATTPPVAFENMTGTLRVQAYLNYRSELDLSQPVALDGLSTLELVYL